MRRGGGSLVTTAAVVVVDEGDGLGSVLEEGRPQGVGDEGEEA